MSTTISLTDVRVDCMRQHDERKEADLQAIDRYLAALENGANPRSFNRYFSRDGLGGKLADQVFRLWERANNLPYAPFGPSAAENTFLIGFVLAHNVGVGTWATYEEITRLYARVTGSSVRKLDVWNSVSEWKLKDTPYRLEKGEIDRKPAYRLVEA